MTADARSSWVKTAPLGFPVVWGVRISGEASSRRDASSLQRCNRYSRSTCDQEGCEQQGGRLQAPRLDTDDDIQLSLSKNGTVGLTLCQIQDGDADALSPLLEDTLLSNTASALQVGPVVHADNHLERLALGCRGEREERGDVLRRGKYEANFAVADAERHNVGSEGIVERHEREGVGRARLVGVLPF